MFRSGSRIVEHWLGHRDNPKGSAGRKPKRSLLPGTESLEGRVCLSTASAAIAERSAELAAINHAGEAVARRQAVLAKLDDRATPLATRAQPAATSSVIYVAPRGRMGSSAGRSPSRPLGSLSRAISMARPGTTIILAPGVYRERITINQKSDITIVGAADQSSIISPSSGAGITVTQSNNVTIKNLWFRASGNLGKGLGVLGSSVNVENIKTNGTLGDGVVVTSYRGRNASLNAVSSHFDGVQLGSGLDLQNGAIATIVNSTFNGNGTSPSVGPGSSGLTLVSNANATIHNSVFVGNTFNGLAAHDSAFVNADGSVFAGSQRGNGAIFLDGSTAFLTNNSFSFNGQNRGPISGFNGLEFFRSFTGNALVANNAFIGNTANGLFVGGSVNQLRISNNIFDDNFFGITLDAAEGSTVINALIQGNTIRIPVNATYKGIGLNLIGQGTTAIVGGGTNDTANLFQNFIPPFVYLADGRGGTNYPNATFLTNYFFGPDGRPVDPSQAIVRA